MEILEQQYIYPQIDIIKDEYISTEGTYNIYAMELTAIKHYSKRRSRNIQNPYLHRYSIRIFTDNQSAIQAVDSSTCQSGQYIVREKLDTIDRIQEIKPPAPSISNEFQDT